MNVGTGLASVPAFTATSSAASTAPSSAASSSPSTPRASDDPAASLAYTTLPSLSGNKTHPSSVTASSTSVPTASRKSSFVHRIKKSLWHGERTINSDDPRFDVAVNNFKQLNDCFYRLRMHMNDYVAHLRGMIATSNTIALDFVLGIDDLNMRQMTEERREQAHAQNQHEYSSILSEVRSTHTPANLERVEQLALQLERRALAPLDNALSAMIPINKDIEKRQHLRSEVDYYFKKLSTLQQDRVLKHTGSSTDNQANPKKESKIERNQLKYEEMNNEFNTFSADLIQRLVNFYNHRVSIMGPSLQTFLAAEKEMSEIMYQNRVSEEKMMEMEEKNAAQRGEVKEAEKVVRREVAKQVFAEQVYASELFFTELKKEIERRQARQNSMASLRMIEEQLQQATQKHVQEAAQEVGDLGAAAKVGLVQKRESHLGVEAEYKKAEKEAEAAKKQQLQEEKLHTAQAELQQAKDLQKAVHQHIIHMPEEAQPSSLPAPVATETATTVQAESVAQQGQTKLADDFFSKPSTATSYPAKSEKELDFASEARSPVAAQPILDHTAFPLRMDAVERDNRASDAYPDRSPSVQEPFFHEKDEMTLGSSEKQLDQSHQLGGKKNKKKNKSSRQQVTGMGSGVV